MRFLFTRFFVHLLIFQSFLFSYNTISVKKNITSILNPTDMLVYNNRPLVSSNGGIYSIVNDSYDVHNEHLLTYDISSMMISNNQNLWIISKGHPMIQILDSNYKLIKKIDYPVFDQIFDVIFSNDYVYIITEDQGENKIFQYYLNDLTYQDSINLTNGFIYDVKIDENKIYVGTDEGLFYADMSNENSLFLSDSWSNVSNLIMLSLNVDTDDKIYISQDGDDYFMGNLENLSEPPVSLNIDGSLVDVYSVNNNLYILTSSSFYLFADFQSPLQKIFPNVPHSFDLTNSFTSYSYFDNIHYFGLENHGVLILENDIWDILIPNTIFRNQFDAITYEDNRLFAVVRNIPSQGIYSTNQSGGFIIDNVLSTHEHYDGINNFYAYDTYNIHNYPLSISFYKSKSLNYWSGTKRSNSIVYDNGKIFFTNSGIYTKNCVCDENAPVCDLINIDCSTCEDPVNLYYSLATSSYSFDDVMNDSEYLNDNIEFPGVVSIDIDDLNNLELSNTWNMTFGHLDGMNGILETQVNPQMTINQLLLDNHNNLLIINQNSELHSQPIAIKPNSSETSIKQIFDNQCAYLPNEIAIDQYNNIWIAYGYKEGIQQNPDYEYSPGGIRMVEIRDIQNEHFDWHNTWTESKLPELVRKDIWSIDIGRDSYGNEILWVLTDSGVQGYIMYASYSAAGNYTVEFQKLSNDFYFSSLSLEEGDKIRVDKQNNAWVVTQSQGLRIIRNNGHIWSENNSNKINYENYNLLSNNVFDIAFDDFGNVFVATDLGVSILETSFSQDRAPENISVSPNPFKIGTDKKIIITNIPKNSTIKIMNLSGFVVKEFYVSQDDRTFDWDGRSKTGDYLKTGIYLVSIYNANQGTGVAKLAIIN